MRYFDVPLNLPHAGTIASRIVWRLSQRGARPGGEAVSCAIALLELLEPYRVSGEEPLVEDAEPVRRRALEHARSLVAAIEREQLRDDQIGQAVRNLFECLAEGQEGALASLRAGERPDSPQRP